MNGLIYYFSTTDNTKLACEYLVKKINGIEFTLSDITKKENLDLRNFDLIGFATWADYLGPSQLFYDFISNLTKQDNKPSFIFCTAGGLPGRTLLTMQRLVSEKGFLVLTGFQLMTPDNYPPIIISGRIHPDYPKEEELKNFNQFIMELNEVIKEIKNKIIKPRQIKIGFLNRLVPSIFSRKKSKKNMGMLFVDKEKCTKCGICAKVCPYSAIKMDEYPLFNDQKCYACWSCYNHCPPLAIYTNKIKEGGQYKMPEEYKRKLT